MTDVKDKPAEERPRFSVNLNWFTNKGTDDEGSHGLQFFLNAESREKAVEVAMMRLKANEHLKDVTGKFTLADDEGTVTEHDLA